MSKTLFPTLKSLAWDVKKSPEFSVIVQKSANLGYDTRLLTGIDPIWHFECNYTALREKAYGASVNELRTLEGMFTSMGGNYKSFLLSLPSLTRNSKDGAVTGQLLIADSNKKAPIVFTPNGLSYTGSPNSVYDVSETNTLETIYELAGVNSNPGTAPIIYMGGTPMVAGSDYTIQGPGVTSGTNSYPGMVAVISATITGAITADFSWYYRVQFEQNRQEFNLFSYLLWEAQQVQLKVTRV